MLNFVRGSFIDSLKGYDKDMFDNLILGNNPISMEKKKADKLPAGERGKRILTKGNISLVLPEEYDFGAVQENGMVIVRKGDPHDYKTRRFGCINRSGRMVLPLAYSYLLHRGFNLLEAGMYVNEDGGEVKGAIDYSGKQIIPFSEEIQEIKENGDLVLFEKEWRWGAYDRSGKIICEAFYDQIIKITDNLYKVGVKEKAYTEWFEEFEVIRWGLIDGDGNEILPHEYPEISSSVVDGMIKIVNQYGKCGFVDITGRFILEPDTYEAVGSFDDGLAIVSRSYGYGKERYYGVVDCSFTEVIPCIFKELHYLAAEGRFKMENGCITKDGRFVAKCDGKEVLLDKKYKFCHKFNNGLAIAQRHFFDKESRDLIVRYGIINSDAEDVFPPEYESIRLLENGAYRLLKDGRFGFADKNGNTLLQPVCERLYKTYEDYAVVKINGSWGLLDMRTFTISMFLTASYLGPCQDKACAINEGGKISEDGRRIIGGKWGFVSPEGKVMVPPEYERITSFCDGAVAVKKDGSWGFVDRRGRVLVPLEYDNVSKSFREGAAGVKKDGRWGFVDKRGVVLVPLEYENVSSFHEDVVAVKKDGKWGFVGRRGEVIVPCEYDGLGSDYWDGRGELEKDGLIYSFDKEGREVERRIDQDQEYCPYDDDSPSYSKYGGYNGYDDQTIDEAFDGNPSLTWNID